MRCRSYFISCSYLIKGCRVSLLVFSSYLFMVSSAVGRAIPERVYHTTDCAEYLVQKAPYTGIDIELPLSAGEVIEASGHQIGMLLILLLPILEIHYGYLLPHHGGQFANMLNYGLLLEAMVRRLAWLPSMVMSSTVEKNYEGITSSEFRDATPLFWVEDIKTRSDSHDPAGGIAVYVKTPSSRGHFFSEADQLIDVANQLLPQGLKSYQPQYSQDNSASLHFLYLLYGQQIFSLSITSPNNVTHTYEIAHHEGSNALLSRDGIEVSNYLSIHWQQAESTALSAVANRRLSSDNSKRLKVSIPREWVIVGLSVLNEAIRQGFNQVLLPYAGVISKVIIAESGSGDMKKPGTEVARQSAQEVISIPSKLHSWLSRTPSQGPEILQAMYNGGEDGKVSIIRTPGGSGGTGKKKAAGSASGGRGDGGNQGADDDPKDRSSSSSSPGSSHGLSLIESVATRRLMSFVSKHPQGQRKVDSVFIKKLSKAGLAQVLLKSEVSQAESPLVISKTLLRFLNKTGTRQDLILQALDKPEYYVELDQTLFSVLEDRYSEVEKLVKGRYDLFKSFRELLYGFVQRQNIGLEHKSQYRYKMVGGEGIYQQVYTVGTFLRPDHYLRDNFPITDDVDVIMSRGGISRFKHDYPSRAKGFDLDVGETVVIAFSFPCVSGSCLFQTYKVKPKHEWSEFLPSMDISFPSSEYSQSSLGDNLHVLVDSIDRALTFHPRKAQKHLDRLLLLKAIHSDSTIVSLLYERWVVHLKILKEKETLLENAATLGEESETLKKKLAVQDVLIEESDQRLKTMETEIRLELKAQSEKMKVGYELKLATLKQALGIGQDDIIALKKQLESISTERERLVKELSSRGKKLSELAKRLNFMSTEQIRTGTQLKELNRDNTQLQKTVKLQSKKIDENLLAQKEKEETEKSLANFELIESIGKLTLQLGGTEQRMKSLEDLTSQLKNESRKKKKEMDALGAAVETINTRVAAKEAEYELLLKDYELLLKEYELLFKEYDAGIYKQNVAMINEEGIRSSLHSSLKQVKEEVLKIQQRGESHLQMRNRELLNDVQLVQEQNERLQAQVRRQWRNHNLQFGLGMVPVIALLYKDFTRKKYYDEAKARCDEFHQDVIYQYCVRKQVADFRTLNVLRAIERMPGYSKVFVFEAPVQLRPGYNPREFSWRERQSIRVSSKKIEKMTLYIPDKFTTVSDLHALELQQIVKALLPHVNDEDSHKKSSKFVQQLTTANVLLCGLMPADESQNQCSTVLAEHIRANEEWPCYLPTLDESTQSCKELLEPLLKRPGSKQKEVSLVPSWQQTEEGKWLWYHPLPRGMNKRQSGELEMLFDCLSSLSHISFCENGRIQFNLFLDNQWQLHSLACDGGTIKIPGTSVALWYRSEKSLQNTLYTCHKKKLLQTQW